MHSDLKKAIDGVVQSWESGDLAKAVRELVDARDLVLLDESMEPKAKLVLIHTDRDGCPEEIVPDGVKLYQIDLTCRESGDCPYCHGNVPRSNARKCPECGFVFDWEIEQVKKFIIEHDEELSGLVSKSKSKKSHPDRELFVNDDDYVSFYDCSDMGGPGAIWHLCDGGWVMFIDDSEDTDIYETNDITYPTDDELGEGAEAYEEYYSKEK